jgi:GST-like protein
VITLYGMSSPNVRKVVIALEEIGLPYEWRHVSVFRGENFTQAFRALNPIAKVPVLVDDSGDADGFPIFESGSILIYLAETYGPELLPASGRARWSTLQWVMAQVANIGPVFGQHSHFRRAPDRAPYAAERFRKTAAELYRILDRRLSESPYLAGDAYSIADVATYPWARYLRRHGMTDEECPSLVAWKARLAERPAVVRAATVMSEMGRLDARDRVEATAEDFRRYFWLHFPAPSADAAATTLDGVVPPLLGEDV